MTFHSILFGDHSAPTDITEAREPACFGDLNLDQIVALIVAPKQPYRLTGYFHVPLDDIAAVFYRQRVFQDLERSSIYEVAARFATGMSTMRTRIEHAGKSHYHYQRQRWFLDAIHAYCQTVDTFATGLRDAAPTSAGLAAVADYLTAYRSSPEFTALWDGAQEVSRGLDSITYNVWVRDSKITVSAYDGEPDYSTAVTRTFERFQQDSVLPLAREQRAHRPRAAARLAPPLGPSFMNHVEAQILDQVVKLFSGRFTALDACCQRHSQFVDPTIEVLDREIQFYVAYLDFIEPLRRSGLVLTYPQMSSSSKEETAVDTFDLALAAKALRENPARQPPVVCNDLRLTGPERILVVSGPNNGGKTTLARTVGQLHYLARLGCPVPGHDLRLYLVDRVFTHFEKQEDIATLVGKLQEELNRMHNDFEQATPRSLLIMNEMFSSTTVHDSLFLSREMLARVTTLDALGVCVTFLEELATLNDRTVSMVSTVDPNDLARRTFKVIRKPADGKAYAQALAEKYGLTYEVLRERVQK